MHMKRELWAGVAAAVVGSVGCGSCGTLTVRHSPEVCEDFRDNDEDLKTDCADPDCFASIRCCVDRCAEGERLCDSAGVRTCSLQSATGCWDLDAPAACTATTVCTGGACLTHCSDRCVEDARACLAPGAAAACRRLATGCLDWVLAEVCTTDALCLAGSCTPIAQCAAQCTVGDTRCTAFGEVQACVALGNGCSDWSFPATCGGGTACAGGACSALADAGLDGGEPADGGAPDGGPPDAGCRALSAGCSVGPQCCSGACSNGYTCVSNCGAAARLCGRAGDPWCCAGLDCSQGRCQCQALGGSCGPGAPRCCAGAGSCVGTTCCLSPGQACAGTGFGGGCCYPGSGGCANGVCIDSVCFGNGNCTRHQECCSGRCDFFPDAGNYGLCAP